MANNEQYASNLLTDKMYSKVNTLDYKSCWLWEGTVNPDGYGVTSRMIHKKVYGSLIHRISWYLLYGNIQEGMVIDHTCHDPSSCSNGKGCEHRRCFNPYHLRMTTVADNASRGAANNTNTGMCKNKLHEWIPENITIWTSGKQVCIHCHRASGARKRLKKEGSKIG